MSKITVTRSNEWNNRLRQYTLYLDGEKLGTIANGEIKTFDVPPGTYHLKAKIDWCGSREVEFSITSGQMKYFRLSGFKYGNLLLPVTLGLLLFNFLTQSIAGLRHFLWFLVPVFLVLAYYLTIGRNDYLRIQSTDTWGHS